MADKRIGELPAAPGVYADTLFAAEQQGEAVKVTARQLVGVSGGGTSGQGGVISFNGRVGAVEPQSGDYTAEQVGAVPLECRINGKPLTGDIELTAADLGVSSGGAGGGFIEMETSIPVSSRAADTLYGLILESY